LDFSRLRNGEIVAAIGGLALFIFMFFNWFGGGVEVSSGGTQEVPGIGEIPNEPTVEETGVSGWDALQDFSGFLIALAAVSGVALGGLAAAGQRLNIGGVPRGAGTATLGSLAVLLILWRFFANPGDLKIGIFLGLVAAIAVAAGALMALREDGFEPFVNVPGERPTAAMASAPAPAAPSPGSTSGGSSSSGGAAKSRSSGGSAPKSRSSGGSAPKSRSKGATGSKSRSSGRKSGRKTTSKKSASSSKKTSGASKPKTKAKSTTKSKSSGSRARSKSSRSKSSGSKSSGTRRRSSGKRK
jgi:hypothetical protein